MNQLVRLLLISHAIFVAYPTNAEQAPTQATNAKETSAIDTVTNQAEELEPIVIGDESSKQRIIGGVDATPNYPYFARLYRGNSTKGWNWAGCGATLISACHLVTAAHCVSETDPLTAAIISAYQIRARRKNNGVPYFQTRIFKTIVHPDYNPQTNFADVAVLTISCVNTNVFPPVDPATKSFIDGIRSGTLVRSVGFGRTNAFRRSSPQVLQEVSLQYSSAAECRSSPWGVLIKDDMVCAGNSEEGQSVCRGDSGGPLLAYSEFGAPTLIGIVSWGPSTCSSSPGVFANIGVYLPWIQQQVCRHRIGSQVSWCRWSSLLPPRNVAEKDEASSSFSASFSPFFISVLLTALPVRLNFLH